MKLKKKIAHRASTVFCEAILHPKHQQQPKNLGLGTGSNPVLLSQRKMLYAEAEGSYTDILYTHILSEKVFPENDGVIKEAQIGGKKSFVRVDLVTRYGQPERYFGIEIKYWPGAFEQGFR